MSDLDKVWASDLTDAQLASEARRVGEVIDQGFGEGSGSPGEWWYERAEEIGRVQAQRMEG